MRAQAAVTQYWAGVITELPLPVLGGIITVGVEVWVGVGV